MSKSNIWKLFVFVLVSAMLLTACGAPAPAEEAPAADAPAAEEMMVTADGFECPKPVSDIEVTSKELNLYVWTEYIPTEWKDCYEMVYGVTINHDEYSSNEEMYAKLEAGASVYDLVQPTDYIIEVMIEKGMLQALDKDALKASFDNLDPNYMDLPFDPGNVYTMPYEAGLDSIIYNAATVDNPPTSYAEMWNDEFAGRIVLLDDSRVVIGMALLKLGYDVNTTDPAQLEEAKAEVAKLVANTKLFDSDSPKTALIGGEVDLGIVWTGEAATAETEDENFKFVYPTEGAIFWQDNWAIPTGAPHVDAVNAWINYTMQADMFYLMLRDFPYLNPNTAALDFAKANHPDLYEPFMASNVTNPPSEALAKSHTISDVGEALVIYDTIWTEVKGE